ncbi:MAG: thioredoxin family protein [Kiritimatiellia bacterium]
MKKKLTVLACLAMAAAVFAGCSKEATPAAPARPAAAKTSVPRGWTDDFEAAKKTAGKDGKTLLVLFTGSDWCIWCQRLEEQILSKPEFLEAAAKDFVLVFLDFPNDESLTTPARTKANRALAGQYGIQGFPTVLLMDATGAVKARTGYRQLAPGDYVAHLRELAKAGGR